MKDRLTRLDVAAGVLLLAGLLVAAALFSHNPGGGPGRPVYPEAADADNVLGEAGAWLAESLLRTLGLAVYVLLISWIVLVVTLLLRRRFWTWIRRFVGWLILVPGVACLADSLPQTWIQSPWLGGGSLGAWLTLQMEASFSPFWCSVLISVGLAGGAILALDFLWAPVLRRGSRGLWAMVRKIAAVLRQMISNLLLGARKFKALFHRPARSADSLKIVTPGPKAAISDVASIPIRHHEEAAVPHKEAQKPAAKKTPPPEDDHYADYEMPGLELLEDPQPFPYEAHEQRLRERAALLEKVFADFELKVRVVGINTGPVITQYEIALETGMRVHKVTRLADDLALNLKVSSVRIVAPIPGKNTVGIEIPNDHRATVRLKEVMLAAGFKPNARSSAASKIKIPLFLGKDSEGRPLVQDLADMPHLLIAGRTGTGKSVCMNAIILSILMSRRPDEVKMVMIDPKMLELSEYGKVPHLMHPVVKDMKKAEAILSWAVDKMEERYDLLSRARVRSIAGYNELSLDEIYRRVQPDDEERRRITDKMPYIVIFVDEMNDLMMMMKKEVESHIIRLAQKSRAAGIHLVVATQKPTVDVITGLIKSNLPARICFQVSSRTDSRVVLDEMGADKLLGKGDMLYLQPGTSTLIRAQGTYLDDEEIHRVTECLECEPCYAEELIHLKTNKEGQGGFLENIRARDEVYESAIEVVVREGRGSVSLLQRTLGIGYGRAARLIDFMAEDGIVGSYNGSNAREVLYSPELWENLKTKT